MTNIFEYEDTSDICALRKRVGEQSELISLFKKEIDDYRNKLRCQEDANAILETKLAVAENERWELSIKTDSLRRYNDKKGEEFNLLQMANVTYKSELNSQKIEHENLREKIEATNLANNLRIQKLKETILIIKSKMREKEQLFKEKLETMNEDIQQEKSTNKQYLEENNLLKIKIAKCNDCEAQFESVKNINENLMDKIQEKDNTILQLKENIKNLNKRLEENDKIYRNTITNLNKNYSESTLHKLLREFKNKYEEAEKEHEAYKEHSRKMLEQEREISKNLRRMIS